MYPLPVHHFNYPQTSGLAKGRRWGSWLLVFVFQSKLGVSQTNKGLCPSLLTLSRTGEHTMSAY